MSENIKQPSQYEQMVASARVREAKVAKRAANKFYPEPVMAQLLALWSNKLVGNTLNLRSLFPIAWSENTILRKMDLLISECGNDEIINGVFTTAWDGGVAFVKRDWTDPNEVVNDDDDDETTMDDELPDVFASDDEAAA